MTGGPRRLGYVPALDGLRGIAILRMLATHLEVPLTTSAGAVGVQMFFVLSGFLGPVSFAAWASHNFIERPFRHRRPAGADRRELLSMSATGGIAPAPTASTAAEAES
jgi:peptidoglycan/LPS O-acetylase OafA/YrhL